MNYGRQVRVLFIFFITYLLFIPNVLKAQLSPEQYLEESPLGSWNNFGADSAPSLGAGLRQIVLLNSGASLLGNPAALAAGSSGSVLDFSFRFQQARLYKFWMVNTGVLSTTGNLNCLTAGLSYAGFSGRIKGWTLAGAYAQTENYSRPQIDYSLSRDGLLYEQLLLSQTGRQEVYAVGLARSLGRRLSFGLTLAVLNGYLRRNFVEILWVDNVNLKDVRNQKISGRYLVFGLLYQFNEKLALGWSLIPPYTRKFQGTSLSAFYSEETQVEIPGAGNDRVRMPLITGLGAFYKISAALDISAEAIYFGWKSYTFNYFGETLERNFKNILRLSSGLSYKSTFRFLRKQWEAPYYAGIMIDPQPMTDVRSTYYYLTFGSGMGNADFLLILSTAIGLEKGSGHNLTNQKVCLSLQLRPALLNKFIGCRKQK